MPTTVLTVWENFEVPAHTRGGQVTLNLHDHLAAYPSTLTGPTPTTSAASSNPPAPTAPGRGRVGASKVFRRWALVGSGWPLATTLGRFPGQHITRSPKLLRGRRLAAVHTSTGSKWKPLPLALASPQAL